MIWLTLLFFGAALGLACSLAKFWHYWKLLRREVESIEARAMHEELDNLEMQDVMQRGDWR